MSGSDGDDTSVRVAVRIRPQNAKEKIDMNQVCTSVEQSANQICLGKDKAFTFDYVFDMDATQEIIFSDVSKPLMSGCLEGYNATLLAYGQTGSGKTYTMGTGFEATMEPHSIGIIPRAVEYLFNGIDDRRNEALNEGKPPPEFKVIAQFLELYNEELIDLLDVTGDAKGRCKSRIRIHEDANGGIYITGASTRLVASLEDTIKCLRDGALCRSTGSTNMNAQSSRSHAIFTLYIRQQRVVKEEEKEEKEAPTEEASPTADVLPEFETLSAKFHFVDLAGSERLKRTGATGDRAKEGISINCGLLALGNVISALGDVTKRGSHVPYRDSKLTRLLQDSLGGNSRTIMIACISPSDCDFMETLNALKYANRARNIRNKVMVNQDKTSRQIAVLRSRIAILEQELFEYKQFRLHRLQDTKKKLPGRRVINADGSEGLSDLSVENNYLQNENEKMRVRVKSLQQTLEAVQARNVQLLADYESAAIKASIGSGDNDPGSTALDEEVTRVVEKYTAQVEELRTRLAEAEAVAAVMQRSPQRPNTADSMLASASMTGSMFCMSSTSMTSSITAGSSIMSASFSGPALPRGSIMSASDFGGDAFLEEGSGGQPEPDLIAVAKMELAKQQQILRRRKGGRKRGSTLEPCSGSDEEEAEEMEVDEEADAEDDDEDDDEDDESQTCLTPKNKAEVNVLHAIGEQIREDKENLQESLATLTSDISLKQRLIIELETKQRQLQAVRDHYEKQMTSLMEKIKETEYERDKVLANVNKVENTSEDRVRKIKEDFEKRLAALKTELRRLNTSKREHTRMQREQQRREMQLASLHRELDEMKRMKVQLLKKVKEEAKRARQLEIAHDREVAQLRREKRIKDNTIRTLETEKRQRENVLRRKHEEVEALRRRKTYRPPMPRPNSTGSFDRLNNSRSAGNTPVTMAPRSLINRFNQRNAPASASTTPRTAPTPKATASAAPSSSASRVSSARSAKMKWDTVERSLTNVVSRRQTVAHFEQDMQNWVHEREKLGRKQEVLQAKLKSASDKQEQVSLEYEVANIRSQLERAQEQISECQTNIIELEETRDEPSTLQLFSRCTISETRYLLERLFQAAVSKGILAQQMEEERKEAKAALESKAAEKEQALGMLRIALQQGAEGLPFDMEELIGPERDPGENDADSLSESDQMNTDNNSTFLAQDRVSKLSFEASSSEAEARRKQKARRLTQTPQELLGVERPPEPLQADSLDEDEGEEEEEAGPASGAVLPDSMLMPPPSSVPTRKTQKEPSSAGPSPTLRRKQYAPSGRPAAPAASGASNLMTTSLYLPRSSGNDSGGDATPPLTPPLGATSPVLGPRSAALRADVNVFSRLTGGVSGRGSPGPANSPTLTNSGKTSPTNLSSSRSSPECPFRSPTFKGMIYAQSRASRSVLECTHVAEGHTKAVLDVDVTPTHMITGSKDRTAKLWDLTKMSEICILGAHHNNVSRVRYCPSQHLLFTVCSYYIKLWDDRATDKCIKTLLSSGLSQDGPPEVSHALRQNICPPGETNIMDLVISENGEEMFLATANSVKLWDLRRFCAVGKLHGNHQAPVMVLALYRGPNSSNRVVTGSKDHYIKVFSVPYGSCGLLTPSADLQPPHYDGIESLALREHTLFSGSRDTCIKKWNLAMPHQENVINNAHRDWIQGLCLLPNTGPPQYLLSGCRAGTLKLWNADDCAPLGDAQAHTSAINAVRTNGQLVFTASNDGSVKFWRFDT